jgi:hypothetical protein
MRILVPVMFANALQPCIQCKHFIPDERIEFGRCGMFPVQQKEHLITGKNIEWMKQRDFMDISYDVCLHVRYDPNLCGEEGYYFTKI